MKLNLKEKLFFPIIFITLTSCGSEYGSTNYASKENSKINDKESVVTQTYIASSDKVTFTSQIMFLEKEQMLSLSVKNNCLIANLPSDPKDYLLILRKHQNPVNNQQGITIGVLDNTSGKTILLNKPMGVSGVSFESEKISFKSEKPENCPKNYIVVGDFL